MGFYLIGQTGVPFGIVDISNEAKLNVVQLNGQSGSYYRNAANLTGAGSFSGSLSGSFFADPSVAGGAKVRIPHGAAPTSPVNGDLWTTVTGVYVQINGSTVGPLSTGGGGGGGGSDANTLNGQSGSYYLNGANITGVVSDSDKLDGQHGDYYRDISNATGIASLTGNFSGNFTGAFGGLPSTTGKSFVNIPHGDVPSSPINGDIWTTLSGLYVRISGITIGPLSTGTQKQITFGTGEPTGGQHGDIYLQYVP